jgi:predicted NAD/FAD-binding protein
MTLERYVAERGYGHDFMHRYLIPMAGAVWSTPPEKMQKFPAMTLLRFWHNHGFLGLHTQHPWRTVDGGSREYVQRLIRPFQDSIHARTPVFKIKRNAEAVTVVTANAEQRYDHVILATHGDQALRLLEQPSSQEHRLLSAFRYQANATDLHTDASVMPRTRRCWASWNYRSEGNSDESVDTTIHYWMNRLQGVSPKVNYFVSLNHRERISDDRAQHRLNYEHPLFDLDAIAAQKELPQLNALGQQTRTWFAGSYFRYGFHEDALLSAVNLSQEMLGHDPWLTASAS